MIDLLIFYVHVVAASGVFTRRWQEGGMGEGFLSLAFMALIFFVGWGMASFVVKLLMPVEGFGRAFNRDTAGLVLLTFSEAVFYYFYFRNGEGGEASRASAGTKSTPD
jgi:hypothetical protein